MQPQRFVEAASHEHPRTGLRRTVDILPLISLRARF
jgi:hypothetical protein